MSWSAACKRVQPLVFSRAILYLLLTPFFFFQAEDGIRSYKVTGVQTCALPILRVPAYKVASFEIVDLELLRRIGATRKPVILSRGMASLEGIRLAIRTLSAAGARDIA